MYSEIGFIFDASLKTNLDNKDNKGNIYGRPVLVAPQRKVTTTQGQVTQPYTFVNQTGLSTTNPNTATGQTAEEGILVYKNPNEFVGTAGVRNYLAASIYKYDSENGDPYISLINYFGEQKKNALILRAADFAYLKDLGVYPINRLWILRRFPENAIVPNNLLAWGRAVQPISTVVGWMKDKEDSPMLSVSFNEVWVDQQDMIDKVLSEILKSEFGQRLPAMMSVPGWSQGLLFGMLKAMGLTDEFDSKNVPTGNPNVLRTGKMRDVNNQGLKSSMSLTLETSYEQKYINGIDPGMAMLDILTNLFKMGTSDQKFILGNSVVLQQLIGNINSNQHDINGWLNFIKELIKAFLAGVNNFIDEISSSTQTAQVTSTSQPTTDSKGSLLSSQVPDKTVTEAIGSFVNGFGQTLIAGTISKYRWPIKGSIALMSGINTTPWHLTIGNPYSPIVNIGNIVVNNVEVKLSNDLGFNDMPARIDVSISTDFGRPLGKQELEKMFNNGYKRVYSASSNPALETKGLDSATAPSGIQAPYSGNVSTTNKSYYDPGIIGNQTNTYRSGSELPGNVVSPG